MKLSTIKEYYIKFMNSFVGKIINVTFYLVLSNAITLLSEKVSSIDLTKKEFWYIMAISTVNIVLVAGKQIVKILLAKAQKAE